MRRQSASFWFQFAARESARQPARCASPSGCSVLPVTRLEMRRLAEARLTARDPVGHPVDHRLKRNTRVAEELLCLRGVDEPGGVGFFSGKDGLFGKALAEFLRQPAH